MLDVVISSEILGMEGATDGIKSYGNYIDGGKGQGFDRNHVRGERSKKPMDR
jgi:hypothetical protein